MGRNGEAEISGQTTEKMLEVRGNQSDETAE